jgi:NADPH:quinone reductase-like Zn-dependent oxidoreductase
VELSNGPIVAAVCSTRNIDLATSLGAEQVVDYPCDDCVAHQTLWQDD